MRRTHGGRADRRSTWRRVAPTSQIERGRLQSQPTTTRDPRRKGFLARLAAPGTQGSNFFAGHGKYGTQHTGATEIAGSNTLRQGVDRIESPEDGADRRKGDDEAVPRNLERVHAPHAAQLEVEGGGEEEDGESGGAGGDEVEERPKPVRHAYIQV